MRIGIERAEQYGGLALVKISGEGLRMNADSAREFARNVVTIADEADRLNAKDAAAQLRMACDEQDELPV